MIARFKKGSYRWSALAVVLFAVLGCVVLTNAKVASQGKEADSEKPQFTATLSEGVTVELVGICDYPDDKVRCWRPDGSELRRQIYVKREGDYQEGKYGFIVRVRGPEDMSFAWNKIGGSKGWWGSCAVMDDEGNKLDGFEAAVIKGYDGRETTNIRVGIATVPWQTVASHSGRGMTTTGSKNVLFSQAFETERYVGITVSVPWRKDQVERIIAVDKNGQMHTGSVGSVASGDIDQFTAKFYELKLSEVAEFAFQTRPYEWVTFKNVSFQPGLQTDVQVDTGEKGRTKKSKGLQVIDDKKMNLSIAIPADWQCYKNLAPAGYKFSWQLLPAKLKVWAMFVGKAYSPADNIPVRQIAIGDVAILKSYFAGYTVRPDSWSDSTISEIPAVSYVADYQDQGKAMVEYRTYLLGKSMVYWFVFRIEREKFKANKVKIDSIVNSLELRRTSKVREADKLASEEKMVDIAIKDFRIRRYPAGGLYTLTVVIQNNENKVIPAFRLNFYSGNPADNLNLHGKPQTGHHGAGPIKPGGVWNERSSAFALQEGVNEIYVVLDIENSIAESDETNNTAKLTVVVKDGQVIKKTVEIEKTGEANEKDKRASEDLSADGWHLWRQRKLSEAEEKFKQAIKKDAKNDNAWNGLGWAQFNQGKKLNAKDSFEKCIGINPKNSAALNGLGWIAHGQGKKDEAITWWEKAVAANPGATAVLSGLTQTYMELKDYDKAIKYYNMWLAVEPDNAQAKAGLEKARARAKAKPPIDLSTPEATIKSFVKAVYDGNLEAAGECVSKDGHDYDEFMEMLATESNHPFQAMIKAMDASIPVEITSKDITKDRCKIKWYFTLGRVYYIGDTKIKKGTHQKFGSYLELVGDKWLIRDI